MPEPQAGIGQGAIHTIRSISLILNYTTARYDHSVFFSKQMDINVMSCYDQANRHL